MAFPTPEEWRLARTRMRSNEAEIQELVRAFFENKFVGGPEGLPVGYTGVTTRQLTNGEKVALRTRIATLCSDNATEWTTLSTAVSTP